MVTSIAHHTRPCPRTQMSRHDRIVRIVKRVVQRCACEVTGSPRLEPAPAMVRVRSSRF